MMTYWNLHYYQHPETGAVVMIEGACDALTADGYVLIGTHMYCEPYLHYGGAVIGTTYVFALTGGTGTGHYYILHDNGALETALVLYPEPAVSVDHEVTDADRDADARRAQAADEVHAERMRGR